MESKILIIFPTSQAFLKNLGEKDIANSWHKISFHNGTAHLKKKKIKTQVYFLLFKIIKQSNTEKDEQASVKSLDLFSRDFRCQTCFPIKTLSSTVIGKVL